LFFSSENMSWEMNKVGWNWYKLLEFDIFSIEVGQDCLKLEEVGIIFYMMDKVNWTWLKWIELEKLVFTNEQTDLKHINKGENIGPCHYFLFHPPFSRQCISLLTSIITWQLAQNTFLLLYPLYLSIVFYWLWKFLQLLFVYSNIPILWIKT